MHFLWTIAVPYSSYSSLVIHMLENVERDETAEPPLQTANLLSELEITSTLMDLVALASISLRSLSPMPSKRVLPPERMMFW